MSSPLTPVPAELADVVLALDGVVDVYPPQGALARIPGLLATAVTNAPPPKEIRTETSDGRTTVTARIATNRLDRTPETAQRVADVLLAAVPEPDVTVDIRVERIG